MGKVAFQCDVYGQLSGYRGAADRASQASVAPSWRVQFASGRTWPYGIVQTGAVKRRMLRIPATQGFPLAPTMTPINLCCRVMGYLVSALLGRCSRSNELERPL